MSAKKKLFSDKSIPEVSPKSTKDQILSAYNEVIELLEEKKATSPLEEKKKEDENAILKKSSGTSLDGIVSHLATLKINLTKQLDTLSEHLLEEFHKLTDLKQAITIEQTHLQDLYGIKETDHSLAALLLLQKEETEKFDREMKETRDKFAKEREEQKFLWDKKQTDLELTYADRQEKLEKQHTREEEDYKYTLSMTRRQEAQTHALKQEALEKDLEDKLKALVQREALLDAQCAEMETLKEKVQKFPEELSAMKEKTTQEITEKLTSQHKFAVTLKEKETEGEKKLFLQTIASLEAKVKEQDAFINQLTQKANQATQQVQSIACKALEASSQRLPYSAFSEKGQEVHQQQKQAS